MSRSDLSQEWIAAWVRALEAIRAKPRGPGGRSAALVDAYKAAEKRLDAAVLAFDRGDAELPEVWQHLEASIVAYANLRGHEAHEGVNLAWKAAAAELLLADLRWQVDKAVASAQACRHPR